MNGQCVEYAELVKPVTCVTCQSKKRWAYDMWQASEHEQAGELHSPLDQLALHLPSVPSHLLKA